MNSLNPLVSTAGVQRVYATKLNRGATPKVLIQVAHPVSPPQRRLDVSFSEYAHKL